MSAIFDSILSGGFSVGMFLACLAAAGLCGLIASLIMSRSGEASKGFLISLVVLPMVVMLILLKVFLVYKNYLKLVILKVKLLLLKSVVKLLRLLKIMVSSRLVLLTT